MEGAAKLLAVDTATKQIVKRIVLSRESVLATTYLNDLRLDLRSGAAGIAYVIDSSSRGPGGSYFVSVR